LMMTPLKGPDGKVHALAQGAISVGGYKYDLNGNVVQKNHPTTGSIPGGANVERGEPTEVESGDHVVFLLNQPDYTTASRVAQAINSNLGAEAARPLNAGSIEVRIPSPERRNLVAFMTRLEGLDVMPDLRSRVVVNERTGTVIAGGDVRISRVAIAHGDLKVSITTETEASQPILVSRTGPGVRTELVSNTRIEVQEAKGIALESGTTVADLVRALNRIKTSTRDMIAILQGIKAAGALHADLIIQ